MSPRPAIFISAVSCELRSARQLVANTLTFLGYESDWQEIFGAEAETEEREVLKLDEKVLGPEHPDTLDTRANLAGALLHQGRYVEAETEARQVVRVDEKVHGAEHPSTLEVRNSLADAIAAQGKHSEAET